MLYILTVSIGEKYLQLLHYSSLKFQENVLAVGGDSLEVEIHDVESERKTQSIVAHEKR